jgi:hypothetical protein
VRIQFASFFRSVAGGSLLLVSVLASPQTAKQVAKSSFPSIALLVLQDSHQQPISLGSGFFVREGVVATSLHVLAGASGGYIKIVGGRTKYPINGIVGRDSRSDLALIAVGTNSPALSLAEDAAPDIGEDIFALGNPEGLEGTLSSGIVSGIRQVGAESLLQITAPISPGSSGGPLLSSSGKVIGITAATYSEGQNLNFAIPVKYLRHLLAGLNPTSKIPLQQNAKSSEGRSVLEDLGSPATAGVVAGQFRWDDNGKGYTFSLRNEMTSPVRDVYCLVILYDRNKNPIDFNAISYPSVLPPGLAKRLHGDDLDFSVFGLVEAYLPSDPPSGIGRNYRAEDPAKGQVEFRVLDFRIAN